MICLCNNWSVSRIELGAKMCVSIVICCGFFLVWFKNIKIAKK